MQKSYPHMNVGLKLSLITANNLMCGFTLLPSYLLFIIFDLEVAFLFPWAVALGSIGMLGFVSMMIFLGVLTIGFIYEWKKGALEWE